MSKKLNIILSNGDIASIHVIEMYEDYFKGYIWGHNVIVIKENIPCGAWYFYVSLDINTTQTKASGYIKDDGKTIQMDVIRKAIEFGVI